MFMDKSKYQNKSASSSTQFYNDQQMVIGNYSSQFQQYQVDAIDVPRHVCPVCNKSFRASSLLDIHMRVHVGAKPFVCPVCNHRATQKGNLKLHMKKHHGKDLPSHIDLVPDSGIWGNFPQNESSDLTDSEYALNNKKKTALAHSSLLNKEVVDLIKKCQNNIGQSTMGRITESLNDFLDIAQKKTQGNSTLSTSAQQRKKAQVNVNSNNNGMKVINTINKKSNNQDRNPSGDTRSLKLQNSSQFVTKEDIGVEKQYCYCKICGWKTTSSGYLNVHMRKHKAESHVCNICGRAFKETWYLKNHMRSHINNVGCDLDSTFIERGRDEKEMRSVIEPSFVQAEDDAKEEHRINDLKADYAMCNKCGLIFDNKDINHHKSRCGVLKSKVEDCALCESVNPKDAFMKALNLTADAAQQKDFRQKENVNTLNTMIGSSVVSLSTEKDSFDCEPEKDAFISLKKEVERSIKENGVEIAEKNFKSLIRTSDLKNLFSSSSINRIMQLFQEDTSQNSCTSVGDSPQPYKNSAMQSLANIGKSLSVKKSQFDSTMSNITNENNQNFQGFKCQYCPKWFKYRSVLGIHMRSHTGERPYKCAFCGYAGTQHNCLKLHIQRHHPEEYINSQEKFKPDDVEADVEQEHMILGQAAKFSPARCPICARVSPSPGYLKIHMRSHKKTLDHVCPICDRGFKEYWYLSTHLRTHDQELNMQQVSKGPCSSDNVTDTAQNMQTTLRNTLLSKQRSVPLQKNNHQHLGHNYLSGTSSWSPLDIHEDASGANQLPQVQPMKAEVNRPHVSKRKAFQPSRHLSAPYSPPVETTRSRKSKPRKLGQGTYLSPVFQELPSINNPASDDPVIASADDDLQMKLDMPDCDVTNDQPLDLTITTATIPSEPSKWEETPFDDEPLNLAFK